MTSAGVALAESGQNCVTQEPAEPVVNIHNEWDPLQEIIVGRLEGLLIPSWEPDMLGCMYEDYFDFYKTRGGQDRPEAEIKRAQKELDELISILEGEGVAVRRPDFRDYSKPLNVPHWQVSSELGVANPRDSLLVIGQDIIETPTAWRSRYFETFAFRSLIKEYYQQGANWIATAGEVNTIKAFKSWGLEVIECPFWNFNNFGGSFHCATLDIRRSGTLQSYF